MKANEAALKNKIDVMQPREVIPRLEDWRFKNDAFIVISSEVVSPIRFIEVLGLLQTRAGVKIKLLDSKDLPKPVKLLA